MGQNTLYHWCKLHIWKVGGECRVNKTISSKYYHDVLNIIKALFITLTH